jgi:hypothetical protein
MAEGTVDSELVLTGLRRLCASGEWVVCLRLRQHAQEKDCQVEINERASLHTEVAAFYDRPARVALGKIRTARLDMTSGHLTAAFSAHYTEIRPPCVDDPYDRKGFCFTQLSG